MSDAIEGYGGTCNAATDRESTVYWARLPVREAERAFSVLSDLTIRPLLRDNDIARERDIIVEEIRSYRDDPGQYVFNLFDRAFFGDTPLGWEIAGEEESVRALPTRTSAASGPRPTGPATRSFRSRATWTTRRSSTSCERNFGTGNGVDPDLHCRRRRHSLRALQRSRARDLSQAHVALGVPGAAPRPSRTSGRSSCMNTVLGEGSSSRLFQKVREEAGLAYDVHSFQTDYDDTGTLQVYAGVAPADLKETVDAILDELRRLRDDPVEAGRARPSTYLRQRAAGAEARGVHATSPRGWASRKRCTNAC